VVNIKNREMLSVVPVPLHRHFGKCRLSGMNGPASTPPTLSRDREGPGVPDGGNIVLELSGQPFPRWGPPG
jgi:hypothetical protein